MGMMKGKFNAINLLGANSKLQMEGGLTEAEGRENHRRRRKDIVGVNDCFQGISNPVDKGIELLSHCISGRVVNGQSNTDVEDLVGNLKKADVVNMSIGFIGPNGDGSKLENSRSNYQPTWKRAHRNMESISSSGSEGANARRKKRQGEEIDMDAYKKQREMQLDDFRIRESSEAEVGNGQLRRTL